MSSSCPLAHVFCYSITPQMFVYRCSFLSICHHERSTTRRRVFVLRPREVWHAFVVTCLLHTHGVSCIALLPIVVVPRQISYDHRKPLRTFGVWPTGGQRPSGVARWVDGAFSVRLRPAVLGRAQPHRARLLQAGVREVLHPHLRHEHFVD